MRSKTLLAAVILTLCCACSSGGQVTSTDKSQSPESSNGKAQPPLTSPDDMLGHPWPEDGSRLVDAMVGEDAQALQSRSERKSSLQQLIDETPDGGVVTIPPGTYRRGFIIEDRENLTVRAEPGTVWIIDRARERTVVRIHNSHNITLEGLALSHDPEGTCVGDALGILRSHDIIVRNNDLSGSGVAGVRANQSANITIVSNHIHNSTAHAVSFWRVANAEVRGNLIQENKSSFDWDWRQGVDLHQVYGEVVVIGNVFVDNPSVPVAIAMRGGKTDAHQALTAPAITLKSNVFASNEHPDRPTIDVKTGEKAEDLDDVSGRVEILHNCFDDTGGRSDVDAHVAWASRMEGNVVEEIIVEQDLGVSSPQSCAVSLDGPAQWIERFENRPKLPDPRDH